MKQRRASVEDIRRGLEPLIERGEDLAARVGSDHGPLEELGREHTRLGQLGRDQLDAWFTTADESSRYWNAGMRGSGMIDERRQLYGAILDRVSHLKGLQERVHLVPPVDDLDDDEVESSGGAGTLTVVDVRRLEQFLSDLRAARDADELRLPPEDEPVLDAHQTALEAQHRLTERADRGIVRSALFAIGRLLEGAAGTTLGQVAFEVARRMASG